MMKIAVVGATGPTGIHLVTLRKTAMCGRSTYKLTYLQTRAAIGSKQAT